MVSHHAKHNPFRRRTGTGSCRHGRSVITVNPSRQLHHQQHIHGISANVRRTATGEQESIAQRRGVLLHCSTDCDRSQGRIHLATARNSPSSLLSEPGFLRLVLSEILPEVAADISGFVLAKRRVCNSVVELGPSGAVKGTATRTTGQDWTQVVMSGSEGWYSYALSRRSSDQSISRHTTMALATARSFCSYAQRYGKCPIAHEEHCLAGCWTRACSISFTVQSGALSVLLLRLKE